ncbi:hypothetical protein GW17_00041244 [Ensete ventricosum]|nr:hypothetical protein GW17_00041244 [Ensete ventricosum]
MLQEQRVIRSSSPAPSRQLSKALTTGFSTSSSRHPQLRAQTPLRSGRKRDRGNGEGDREAARPPPPPSILAPPPFSYPLGILSILLALPSLRKVRVSLVLSFLAMLDLGLSVSEVCAAGDSAKYQRSSCFGDDVVIVAQCSSGLQAVADVAAAIKAGFYDIGIGAGLESMTVNSVGRNGPVNPKVEMFPQARDCLLPMGITSENVAERYGITRQEQDHAAVSFVESHRRAAAATAAGKFKEEIIPVLTKIVDPKTGEHKRVTISMDDGIRMDTSLSVLAKLKPAFKKDGSTTAVGVEPGVMGIGPAVAIPAAVRAAGLQPDDIDIFEINEVILELDPEKVNVNGGAIALGHPLGATGARCVSTLLNEMKRRGKACRFGVISMCIGEANTLCLCPSSGMGAAAVFERGDVVDQLINARQVEANSFLSKDAM